MQSKNVIKLKRYISFLKSFVYNKTYGYYLIKTQPRRHRNALNQVKGKEMLKIVFFALFDSVWKYDEIYQLMEQHPRFNPIILVCPIVNYGRENMLKQMQKSYNMFAEKGYHVIKSYNEENDQYIDVKKDISPDIIFYTNPYKGLIDNRYYITCFSDTLTCYLNYSFAVINDEKYHNKLFSELLWRYFCETPIHENILKNRIINKDNLLCIGYPGLDVFLKKNKSCSNPWKIKDKNFKRIIWAPHHTIETNWVLVLSNFLEYAQFMVEIAEKYKNVILIAFKPHPLLKDKLYKHKAWGKEKTDAYYDRWKNMENGQLEEGEYVDLFLTSDAMIHDCGSFIMEYLTVAKPVCFMVHSEETINYCNEFGKKALKVHYKSFNRQDILKFINDVVINEDDHMQRDRLQFVINNIQIFNDGKSASERILEHIIGAVGI